MFLHQDVHALFPVNPSYVHIQSRVEIEYGILYVNVLWRLSVIEKLNIYYLK